MKWKRSKKASIEAKSKIAGDKAKTEVHETKRDEKNPEASVITSSKASKRDLANNNVEEKSYNRPLSLTTEDIRHQNGDDDPENGDMQIVVDEPTDLSKKSFVDGATAPLRPNHARL